MMSNHKAKKYLGQNFLTRDHYAIVMADAAFVSKKDTVLEVGPGKGILTNILLQRAGKVVVVEKDKELIPLIEERFAHALKNKKLILHEGDVRQFVPKEKNYKLIANIPYYITGEILRHFLECKNKPTSMTLMVQKEVAERIVARGGKESLLSLSVKAYGVPSIIAKVTAGNFQPKPKVDSAILHIENISRDFFKTISEETFFKIIKAGFAHKRKKLLGNLSSQYDRTFLEEVFTKEHISSDTRAENLTLAEWKNITRALHTRAVK